jgi:hypothetical protein
LIFILGHKLSRIASLISVKDPDINAWLAIIAAAAAMIIMRVDDAVDDVEASVTGDRVVVEALLAMVEVLLAMVVAVVAVVAVVSGE